MYIQKIFDALLDWIFPPVCLLCGEFLPLEKSARDFCAQCSGEMPFIEKAVCPNCGRPLGQEETVCRICKNGNFLFQRGFGAFTYADMRHAIHHFKFRGCKQDAKPLGRLMVEYMDKTYPALWQSVDVLVPVPAHKKRQKSRGFNQAALLAQEIGKRTQIPCVTDNLVRIRETAPQNKLNALERLENCRNAFGVLDGSVFQGKRILLIDDIYTTGATANACAGVLYRAGAKEVIPYSLSIVVYEEEYYYSGDEGNLPENQIVSDGRK